MSVTLATYCCPKDIELLYAPGMLRALVESHKYAFDEILLIRQHCQDIDVGQPEIPCRVLIAEDYPDIRTEFGIREDNPIADQYASGTRYYWRNCCWNQLIAIKEAKTQYLVLADCDTALSRDDPSNPWVDKAIALIQGGHSIIVVTPSTGSYEYRTKAMTQIICLFERKRFLELDYEAPLPPGELWGRFHFNWEGRVYRYLMANNAHRSMLAEPPRVIHHAW